MLIATLILTGIVLIIAYAFHSTSPTVGYLFLALVLAAGPEKIRRLLKDYYAYLRRIYLSLILKGFINPSTPVLVVTGKHSQEWEARIVDANRVMLLITPFALSSRDLVQGKEYDIWLEENCLCLREKYKGSFWIFKRIEDPIKSGRYLFMESRKETK